MFSPLEKYVYFHHFYSTGIEMEDMVFAKARRQTESYKALEKNTKTCHYSHIENSKRIHELLKFENR